uniref:Sialin n=1 Tax=Romanomermis culicivorax TaxID=13658 RepID=A0A915KHR9_ROMCU
MEKYEPNSLLLCRWRCSMLVLVTSKPGVRDVPWRQVLTSSAVWAVVVSHFTNNWGLYTLMTTLPTYFKKVQGFDIKKNGFVSALPYLVQFIFHVGSGRLADFLRVKFNLKTVHVRKLFDCLGHLLPGLAIIALGFVGCNDNASVALLVLTVGSTGFCGAGWYVNFLDLAPQYAGILFGVSNTFSTIPGIVGPYLAGVLTKENTVGNWRIVFFIIAALYVFSAVFYAIFGQGHVQSWAETPLIDNLKQKPTITGSESTKSRKTPASVTGPKNSTTET